MTKKKTNRITAKQRAFLAAYAECGIISLAAESAKCSRALHYLTLKKNEKYAEEFEAACQEATESLEAAARRRAVDGIDEPVFHNGKICGHKRRYSDLLLIFLLKAANPDKYAEHSKSEVTTVTEPVQVYLPENGR